MGLHIYSQVEKDKEIIAELQEKIEYLVDGFDVTVNKHEVVVEDEEECVPANFESLEDFNAGVEFVLDLLRNGWTSYTPQ